MTKKDYIAFAQVFEALRDECIIVRGDQAHATLDRVVAETADIFARDNSRFDRAKFLKACGLEG